MSDWTEHELATLAELAETFVRGDARRRARLVTEAIERAADPAQVRQFHRLLGLMESRWANLLSFAGRPVHVDVAALARTVPACGPPRRWRSAGPRSARFGDS